MRARGRSWLLAALFACSALACTDDASGAFESDLVDDPGPARGISITTIEINQGTAIDVGLDDAWIAPADRSGRLLATRDALLRVHYTVEAGWAPRTIEARLILSSPQGDRQVRTQQQEVPAEVPAGLDGTFWFALSAAAGDTAVGTRFQVELWEAGVGVGEDVAAGIVVSPAAGPAELGFEAVSMQMRLLLVPIDYEGRIPDLSDEFVGAVLDGVYEQNPIGELLYDVHPPVVYDGALTELGELLPLLAALRADEQIAANVYVHALVDVGAPTLNGTAGIADIAGDGDSEADAAARVQATVVWSGNPILAVDTVIHELGHSQGLRHVACEAADAAEPDLSYPHAGGLIGRDGYGLLRGRLYQADQAYDYMSYCGPTWASDWTWAKTFARIETLSAWELGAPASASTGPGRLIGVATGDAVARWWLVPGAVAGSRSSEGTDARERFVFTTREGVDIEGWGSHDVLSDGRTAWIEVALPVAVDELAAVSHRRGEGQPRPLSLAQLGRIPSLGWTPRLRAHR